MNLIHNDIIWWQISLFQLMNAWFPGISAFLLGMLFNKIIEKNKLKQSLKNTLLEIFIPIFNVGKEISKELAIKTKDQLRNTLNTYSQIYPSLFKKEKIKELNDILKLDLIEKSGKLNEYFNNPTRIIKLIESL
ncbi:hypothetical protein [Sediminispirochaeta smaragdinae]|uniref:Uncharacterized protein n=1 Tax=Sediminispirochaeta smaragdinae (strain DSM 11293 / JCM 15392 / SEBR 4228) TaxID=573413 RepID=E1RB29_SEDSS|nr:hypothetical protein [Sediminispirochaeta smaragdinae]ADK79559.1 conserved hypothetical protein [Sediminispirochaeta smaragdinae DSM 11293]